MSNRIELHLQTLKEKGEKAFITYITHIKSYCWNGIMKYGKTI